MAAHGLGSIAEYFTELRRFTMIEYAAKITCPTLIVEADHDFAGGGGTRLKEAMQPSLATLAALTAEAGAEGHCAGLGQDLWAQTVYGWLARTLATSPIPTTRTQ